MLRNQTVPPALRKPEPPAIKLALRCDEAAAALGICSKTLRDLLDGPPVVRIGRACLYPVSGLQRWLDDRAEVPADAVPGSAADLPSSI